MPLNIDLFDVSTCRLPPAKYSSIPAVAAAQIGAEAISQSNVGSIIVLPCHSVTQSLSHSVIHFFLPNQVEVLYSSLIKEVRKIKLSLLVEQFH